MRIIKLEIEDSKVEIILDIIQNLKDNIVKHYEVINEDKTTRDFIGASENVLSDIWDNEEDRVYDKYLEV